MYGWKGGTAMNKKRARAAGTTCIAFERWNELDTTTIVSGIVAQVL